MTDEERDDKPPTVVMSSGATATATITNGVITGITITTPGPSYTAGLPEPAAAEPGPSIIRKVDWSAWPLVPLTLIDGVVQEIAILEEAAPAPDAPPEKVESWHDRPPLL